MRISLTAGAGLAVLSLLACGDARSPNRAPADSAAVAQSPSAAAPASDSVARAGVQSDLATGDTASGIGQAAGFAWGATRDEIVGRRGPAVIEREDFEGVKTLGYEETLLGQPTILVYFVHPERGMVRASYGARLTSVEQCEQVVSRFEGALARRYAAIKPERLGDFGPGRCASYVAGGPGFRQTWRDAGNGARAVLALVPGAGAVSLTYTTPAADEWERRKAGRQP